MFNPAYIGVVTLGVLHGFEPGHGWPLAVLYSMGRKNAVASAVLTSSIIGFGHLASAIAVVVAYVLLQDWLDFQAPWIKYVAAALLIGLAFRLYRQKVHDLEEEHGHSHPGAPEAEHEHEHPGDERHTHTHKHRASVALSLAGLASFAFILGFAHEEEIALLALVAGGLDAWVLMIAYGVSVLSGLVVATVVGVNVYKRFQSKLAPYEKYIPKISAALLVVMAVVIAFW